MARSLAKMVMDMELRTADFQRGMRQTVRAMERTERQSRQLNQRMVDLGRTVRTAASGFLALAGISFTTGALREFIDTADQLGKLSSRLGLTVESLQKLQFAAELSGVSADTLNIALQRFTRRLADARQGTGQLSQVLSNAGIALRNVDGTFRSTEEVLADFSDALAETPDQAARVRAAFAAFDSEGVKLVQLFQQGSAAVRELGNQAEATGSLLSETLTREAALLNDRFEVLSRRLQGFVLIPVGEFFVTLANDVLRAAGSLDAFGQAIADVIQTYTVVGRVYRALTESEAEVSALTEAQNRLARSTQQLAEQQRALGLVEVRYGADSERAEQVRATIERIQANIDSAQADVSALFVPDDTVAGFVALGAASDEAAAGTEAVRDGLAGVEAGLVGVEPQTIKVEREVRQLGIAFDETAIKARQMEAAADALNATFATPLQAYDATIAKLDEINPKLLETGVLTRATAQAWEDFQAALVRSEGLDGALARVQRLSEESLTAEEQLREFTIQLDRLVELGQITPAEASTAAAQAWEQLADTAEQENNRLEQQITSTAESLGGQLGTALAEGEDAWKSFAETAIQQILRIVTSQAVAKLVEVIAGISAGGSSIPNVGGTATVSTGPTLLAGISSAAPSILTGGIISPSAVSSGGDGPSVSIINTGAALQVESTRTFSDGSLELVVSTAAAQTQADYARSLRRGYGGYSEPISRSTTSRRRV